MPFDPDKFLQQSAPQEQAPSGSFSPDVFMAQQPDPIEQLASVGTSPKMALPESPLSPMERGAFGWIKDRGKQKEYLTQKFGKGNVEIQKMDENAAGFIVKSPDGKWRQVDPHGLSDIPLALLNLDFGGVRQDLKNALNPNNTAGGALQFLGEHGFNSAGAAIGGTAGAAYGSALGPLGTLGGLALGGAVGGMAGGLGERGTREVLQALQDSTGAQIPGAGNTEDFQHQMMGNMLFGASQELAGPFLKAGLKGSASVFGRVLKTLGDTPEAKQAQAAIIKGLSGIKDGLARAWADAPEAVSKYIPQAIKDRVNNEDGLVQGMKAKLENFVGTAQSVVRGRLGGEYDAIEKKAADKVFDALKPGEDGSNPLAKAYQRLNEEGYLKDGAIAKMGTNEITRDTTGTNGQALRRVLDNYQALVKKEGQASYQDLRIMERNLENYMFGDRQVTDGTLRSILADMRSGINTVQSQGLHEVDPGLADQLAALNAKYGPAKELLGTLGQKSKDQRLDAFLKQVIRDDGSYNAQLMNSVSDLLGINNPTKDILHMEVARNSAPWFTGSGGVRIAGIPIPASPRLASNVVQYGIQPYQELARGLNDASKQIAQKAASYLPNLHMVYKNLPEGARKAMVQSPEAISIIGKMMTGAAVAEGQDKNQLLQGTGAFQQSQMGQ